MWFLEKEKNDILSVVFSSFAGSKDVGTKEYKNIFGWVFLEIGIQDLVKRSKAIFMENFEESCHNWFTGQH